MNGFRLIPFDCVCVTVDTMLNVDGGIEVDVKCEQSISSQFHPKTKQNKHQY